VWTKSSAENVTGVTEQTKGNVYIVDDEKIVRYHLSTILESEGYVTESFASGEAFLAAVPASVSGCVLLDVSMPGGMTGPEIQRLLSERKVPLSIIFVTAHASVPMAVEAMKSGAVDVLIKPIKRESLLPAVEKALVLSVNSRQQLLEQQNIGALAKQLTGREKEVLSLIVEGKLNKEVAYALGITERTVKAHRANIMEKLGMISVTELVRFADRFGVSRLRES
jgi:FixJ family two-component response regulator